MSKQSINDFLTKKIKDNSNSKIECLNLCLKIEKEGIDNINLTHYDNDEFNDFKNEMMSYLSNKEYHDKSNANILQLAFKKQNFINSYKNDIFLLIEKEEKRRLELENKPKITNNRKNRLS